MCTAPQAEDVAYTCETAAHFWLLHVYARWERFAAAVAQRKGDAKAVAELFPFKEYFADVLAELLKGESYEQVRRAMCTHPCRSRVQGQRVRTEASMPACCCSAGVFRGWGP